MLQKKNIFILLLLTALFYLFNISTSVFEWFFLLFSLTFILVYRLKKNMDFHKVLLFWCSGTLLAVRLAAHVSFARHGRALAGESPEHAQVVGNV